MLIQMRMAELLAQQPVLSGAVVYVRVRPYRVYDVCRMTTRRWRGLGVWHVQYSSLTPVIQFREGRKEYKITRQHQERHGGAMCCGQPPREG